MKSDLAAWIDEVGTDTERAIIALHDATIPPVDGHCPTCRTVTSEGDFYNIDLTVTSAPAPFPCETARLVAWAHQHQPGFRPGWTPTRQVAS